MIQGGNHRWLRRGRLDFHRYECRFCDAKRWHVPGLGTLYTIGFASPSLLRPPCPALVDSVVAPKETTDGR